MRLGFDRTKLVESIRTRQQNEATVTYWLLLDNRRRMPSSGYLAHELSEAVAAASAGYLGSTGMLCTAMLVLGVCVYLCGVGGVDDVSMARLWQQRVQGMQAAQVRGAVPCLLFEGVVTPVSATVLSALSASTNRATHQY